MMLIDYDGTVESNTVLIERVRDLSLIVQSYLVQPRSTLIRPMLLDALRVFDGLYLIDRNFILCRNQVIDLLHKLVRELNRANYALFNDNKLDDSLVELVSEIESLHDLLIEEIRLFPSKV